MMWRFSICKILKLVGASNRFCGIFGFVGKHQVKARNLKKLKALGNHIRNLRTKKGLTQEQLADLAAVSENTIATLESGKLNTTVATCFDIAKALDIKDRDIFDF
jgi:DNA-binding XRE family transcriptional regulator